MRFELYPARRGLFRRKQWRWRFVTDNGRFIAASGEGYNNRADALHAIELLQKHAGTAEVRKLA